DEKFLHSIVWIASLLNSSEEFFLVTNDNKVYVYGTEICSYLSFKHDPNQPQQICFLDGLHIVQVDSGKNFVAILNVHGQVFIASDVDSKWQTNNTFRMVSTGNDRFEMIACGAEHLLLLRRDGIVFALGDNRFGQLATSSMSSYDTLPVD
ncbi:hypothetical protein BLA29_012558, partial [Euroglyphus maynei]